MFKKRYKPKHRKGDPTPSQIVTDTARQAFHNHDDDGRDCPTTERLGIIYGKCITG